MGARRKTEPHAEEHIVMPTYTVVIEGRSHVVEVAKESDNVYRIKMDGQPTKATVSGESLQPQAPFSVNIEGKPYRIELDRIEWNKDFKVKVEEAVFTAELKNQTIKRQGSTVFEPVEAAGARHAATKKVQRTVQGAVVAPMTGKVVVVKVKKGELVKEKQVLCVIEAMKMENEIASPNAGRVEEVNVSEGSAVSEGEVLFVVV
jgi:biotin carboxyl carrier protein